MFQSMKTKRILIHLIAICAFLTSEVLGLAQAEPLGQFEGHGDIGSPAITGSASYDPAHQSYTLTAGGINIWGTNDQCHFLWKKMNGDFILRARLEPADRGVVEHRKIGWMVRSSLAANAAFVDGVVENGVGLTSLQYRRFEGGPSAMMALSLTNTDIVQLERRGTNYIFSAALADGPFASTNCSTVSLPDNVFAGLCLCSHDPKIKEAVVFYDVQIIRPDK
jgi:TolB protein